MAFLCLARAENQELTRSYFEFTGIFLTKLTRVDTGTFAAFFDTGTFNFARGL